jgi:hypothetical protein
MSPSATHTLPPNLLNMTVPKGHMIEILKKGLDYLEAEARYRGVSEKKLF